MITEDYVSFETAKLLKEKGFDEATLGYYLDDKDKLYFDRFSDDWNSNHVGYISAPTLQMAMKWLEEEKEYIVYPYPVSDGKKIEWRYSVWFDNGYMFLGQILEYGTDESFNTREEATEAGIKYCLENLI